MEAEIVYFVDESDTLLNKHIPQTENREQTHERVPMKNALL